MAATGYNIRTTSDTISFRDQTTGMASISFDHATETLTISHDGTGVIAFGDTSSDIFLGDGVTSVDLIMEVDGAIKGDTDVTLTLGSTDSDILIASPTVVNNNFDITGTLGVTGDITMGGATVLTGISSSSVTDALGYTPVDPSTTGALVNNNDIANFITGISSSSVTDALGYTPVDPSATGTFINQNDTGAFAAANHTHALANSSSAGFMSDSDFDKLGAIEDGADVTPSWVPDTDPNYITGINSSDVTNALGYTPVDPSTTGTLVNDNDIANFITGISSSSVTDALGYTPVDPSTTGALVNDNDIANFITGINSSNVTDALGYTPVDPSTTGALVNDNDIANFITGISSSDVTDALGYTPLSSETDDQTLDEVLTQGNTSSQNISVGAITGSALTIDTNTLYVDATNDRVGIGTTSPAQKLHVDGVTYSTLGFKVSNGYSIGALGYNSAIRFNNGNILVNNTSASEFARFDAINSRVGIGTTSPSEKLDVVGNVEVSGTISTGGTPAAEVGSWLHVGRQWSFSGLPFFNKTGGTARRLDGAFMTDLATTQAASQRAQAVFGTAFNDISGYSGAGTDYSRALGASIKAGFFIQGQNSAKVIFAIGFASTSGVYADADPISNYGFGVEFRRGSGSVYEWRVFGHNGTSLSASSWSSSGITYSTDPRTIAIYSDGSGNITAYTAMYGDTNYTTITTTGGPTATSGTSTSTNFAGLRCNTNASGYVTGAYAKARASAVNFYAE